MHKRLLVVIAIVACMSASLVGCSGGSYTSVMSNEINTKNRMEMTYSKFNGNKFTVIDLKEGEEITFQIEVTTKEGNLKVFLIDKDDNKLFELENPKEAITKTVKINKSGKYKIKIEGKHSGSCKINWTIGKTIDFNEVANSLTKKREDMSKNSHTDMKKYSDWFKNEEDELKADEIEKIKTATLDKSKKYDKDKKLTYNEAKKDVDELFKIFKYSYGPYKYFGGDEAFNKSKESILNEIKGKDSIVASDFREIIAKNLSFIKDKNLSIEGKITDKGEQPFMFTKYDFYKDDKGYYKLQEDKKYYIKSIDGSSDLDKYMKLAIGKDGNLVYTLVVLQDDFDIDTTKPSGKVNLQVVFKSDKGETTEELQLEFKKYEKKTSNTVDCSVKDGVATIKMGETQEWKDEEYDKKLMDTIDKIKGSEVLILDFRGNAGKISIAMKKWCESYLGVIPESRHDGLFLTTMLIKQVNNESIDEKVDLNFAINEGNVNKLIKNDKRIFILTDKYTSYEAELFLLPLSTGGKVVLVGTNTSGNMIACENGSTAFKLINSNIDVWLSRLLFLGCYPATPNQGVQPDIWVDGSQAEETVMNLIKYYGLSDKK